MYKIRNWLYTSSIHNVEDERLLDAYRIRAVLQLAEKVRYPHVTSFHIPIHNGMPITCEDIFEGREFIMNQHAQGKTLLIACGKGISRSTVYSIVALKEIEALPLFEAYKAVHEANPFALPDEALWNSLCGYYHEPVQHLEVVLHSVRHHVW